MCIMEFLFKANSRSNTHLGDFMMLPLLILHQPAVSHTFFHLYFGAYTLLEGKRERKLLPVQYKHKRALFVIKIILTSVQSIHAFGRGPTSHW